MDYIIIPNLCYNSCWDKGFCDRGGKCWIEELLLIDNFEELNNIKKNGVTKKMIKNAETLKHNDDIESVDNATQHIKIGRVYKHFKGKLYLVLDVAQHSETGEQYVVYKALYGNCKTYIRPYNMFASKVDREKYPDVKQEFRFQLVED